MRGWRRWNLVAVVVAAVAGAMLAPDEVLAGDGLIQAALRAVDYNSGKLTSILAADSTTPVAPLAATDQGVAFIVHNPARLDLIARFATCRTTTPLVVTEALLDAQSRTLIASGSASPWEITTQSFYVPLPKEPATLAVAFGFDASYAWRQLPQEVAYNFYLYDARTMDVVGLVETIRVLPRNPTVPWLYLAQPAPGRRVYQGQPLEFSGDAYDSFDQSAVTTWMLWKRANGAVFGNGPQVTVSDWLPGEHVARLEVANSARITTAVTTLVSVVAPQPPTSVTIVYPTTGVSVPYGTPLTVEGVAYDFVDGVVSDPGMNWNSDRQAGLLATGRFATVSLAEPLTNTIVLTAVNSIGMAAVASVEVFVEPPLPSVQIVQPSNGQPWIVGQTLSLEGHATSPSEGTLTGEALVWRDGAGQLLGTGESVTTTPATTGAYAITLEATTSFGKTARVTHTVNVLAVPPPMATITGPDPGGAYYETLPVTFVGYGYDQAYGAWIEDPGLNWSSSLIGPLGQGRSFQVLLPAGEHVVTLTATGNATSGTATMALVVQPAANIPGPTVEIESPAAGQLIHTGESVAFVGWAHEYPSVQIFDQQAAWTSSVDGVVARGLLGQSGAPRATLSTGVHELSLAITDSRGKTTVATWSVTVLDGSTCPAPVAGIDSVTLLPRPGAYGGGPIYRDSAVLLQGHATDWKGQPLTVAQFSWTSSLQGALGTGATTAAEMTVAGTHVVTLAVTDNRGLTDVTTMALEVLSRPPPELEVQLSDEVTIYRPPDPIGWDPYTWSREGTKYHGNALHLRAMSWDPVDGPLPVDVTASSIGYVMTVPPESFPQFVATTAEL
ncbi:MAG: hypothetical protein HY816_11440 [Candidatus Wallbacteria bacterium]|nr:hypothetical protein [Candidatus Wallbacteria bacterium]